MYSERIGCTTAQKDGRQVRELLPDESIDVGVDFTNFIVGIDTGDGDTVTAGFVHAYKVVAFINRENEQRVLLGDPMRGQSREEGSKGIVVRFELGDIPPGTRTKS